MISDQHSTPGSNQSQKWQKFPVFLTSWPKQSKHFYSSVPVLSFKDDKTSVLWPASRPKQGEHVRHRGVRGRRQEPSLSQDGADPVAEVKLQKLNKLRRICGLQKSYATSMKFHITQFTELRLSCKLHYYVKQILKSTPTKRRMRVSYNNFQTLRPGVLGSWATQGS